MSPSTTPRLMHRPWTHLAHLVSLSVYVCVFWPSGVWPDPPSHLPGRAAGRRRESGGQSEIPGIPATPPPPSSWAPCGVHTGLIKGNGRKRQKKPTESCSPAFKLSLHIYIKKKKSKRPNTWSWDIYGAQTIGPCTVCVSAYQVSTQEVRASLQSKPCQFCFRVAICEI